MGLYVHISCDGVDELAFIDRIVAENKYLKILKNNLLKNVDKIGVRNRLTFYQDNDPKHKLPIVQKCCIHSLDRQIDRKFDYKKNGTTLIANI